MSGETEKTPLRTKEASCRNNIILSYLDGDEKFFLNEKKVAVSGFHTSSSTELPVRTHGDIDKETYDAYQRAWNELPPALAAFKDGVTTIVFTTSYKTGSDPLGQEHYLAGEVDPQTGIIVVYDANCKMSRGIVSQNPSMPVEQAAAEKLHYVLATLFLERAVMAINANEIRPLTPEYVKAHPEEENKTYVCVERFQEGEASARASRVGIAGYGLPADGFAANNYAMVAAKKMTRTLIDEARPEKGFRDEPTTVAALYRASVDNDVAAIRAGLCKFTKAVLTEGFSSPRSESWIARGRPRDDPAVKDYLKGRDIPYVNLTRGLLEDFAAFSVKVGRGEKSPHSPNKAAGWSMLLQGSKEYFERQKRGPTRTARP